MTIENCTNLYIIDCFHASLEVALEMVRGKHYGTFTAAAKALRKDGMITPEQFDVWSPNVVRLLKRCIEVGEAVEVDNAYDGTTTVIEAQDIARAFLDVITKGFANGIGQ